MRAALIYISEYMETRRMMTENKYNNDELLMRLRAVFGRVDQVRDHIDRALQQDDAHHRKRDMRFLILPTRFPRPESMGQGDIAVGQTGYDEETEEIMKQLEEERDSRSDPDDPFNGTANGVFLPLQDPLSLPLQYRHQNDMRTAARIENLSQNPRENVMKTEHSRRDEKIMKRSPLRKESHVNSKTSRESPTQWRAFEICIFNKDKTDVVVQELNQTPSPAPQTPRIQVSQQEDDLITFTPFGEQQVPQVQGAVGNQEQPKGRGAP